MSGYPSPNGMGNNPYENYQQNVGYPPQQPPPPSGPFYGNDNYPMPPYGANQMPSGPYGYGGGNAPTSHYGGQAPSPNFNQPGQQYGGYGNMPQQPSPYPPANPTPYPNELYPNLAAAPQAPPPVPYYGNGVASPVNPPQYQHEPLMATASLEHYQGTIYPFPHFNAEADCRALSQAMKGIGTNERLLTDVTVNRSNAQRQQIRLQYKTMFGMSLITQLRGELRGNFRELVSALFSTPAEFDARSLNQAINDGRNATMSEILLTRTNAEILAIIAQYRELFNKNLEKDINDRVRAVYLKRMLISALQANRDELTPQQIQQARQMGVESIIDRNRARQDVDDLYKAGAGKWGTDEKTFNCIFARYNYYQLRAVFEEYQQKYRQDIAQVIRSEFSGDIRDAYLLLITYIRDRATYFAERLHRAMDGIGTTDTVLIRIIVTRAEIDLVQIKERYQQLFKKSLAQDVAGDTSGDYKKMLLAIIK